MIRAREISEHLQPLIESNIRPLSARLKEVIDPVKEQFQKEIMTEIFSWSGDLGFDSVKSIWSIDDETGEKTILEITLRNKKQRDEYVLIRVYATSEIYVCWCDAEDKDFNLKDLSSLGVWVKKQREKDSL